MSDLAKYEKARELKKHIHNLRADYMKGMRSSDNEAQQKSVAVYLIDRLALRVGNEKNTEEEADTVRPSSTYGLAACAHTARWRRKTTGS